MSRIPIGRSHIYGGDSDLFTHEGGHVSRCDTPGGDGIEATRCPVCHGTGKVPYTYGHCTQCRGSGRATACFKHKVYWL